MYTIVIADDEKLICDDIQSVVTSFLPELEILQIFYNGNTLYEYLQSHQPDIVLLDIEMNGKTGLDIARIIEEHQHKSYVIIITAHQNFEYAKEAIDARVDAFLTKPFSSRQLIDAIRKATSVIMQKHAAENLKRTARRSILQTLLSGKTITVSDQQLILCNGTASLEELRCTEIAFPDTELSSLPENTRSALVNALIECVETDTPNQSSFFFENRIDCITVLVFSKKEPDLSFIPILEKIISSYTNTFLQCTVETYSSLSQYTAYISFITEMNAFHIALVSSGSTRAKEQLMNYVRSLSAEQRQSFSRFLEKHYQIAVAGSDSDNIIRSLDTLIDKEVNSHSGNYFVDSAREYINNNFASCSLSLESTAESLSISANYLGRIFKKHTGCTFPEYLLKVRMDHARTLLSGTNLSTIDIAEAVGYNNPAYFRSSFKTYVGMTPRQFRMLQTSKE